MESLVGVVLIMFLIGGLVLGAIAGVDYLNDAAAHRQRSRAALEDARERGKEIKRQAQQDAAQNTLKAFTIRSNALWAATVERARSLSLAAALIAGAVIGNVVSLGIAGGVYWMLSKVLLWLHKRHNYPVRWRIKMLPLR